MILYGALESKNNSLHISTMETFTDTLLQLNLFVTLIYQAEMSQEITKPLRLPNSSA